MGLKNWLRPRAKVPARLEGDALAAEIERRKAAAVRSGIPQKVVKFYGDGLKYFPAWSASPENRRWVTPGVTIVDVGSWDDGFTFEYCGPSSALFSSPDSTHIPTATASRRR